MPIIGAKGSPSSGGFGQFAQASGPVNYIEDVFSTYLYAGNSSTQTITNNIDLSTKGGLVWIKYRNFGDDHVLFDTARGATNYLISNTADSQSTIAQSLTSFNSNGFSLGSSSRVNGTTTNPANYVSWTFRKQPKFFDVLTYTGNGSSPRDIAHSLGSVPGCIIVKRTDSSGDDWQVFHRSLTSDSGATPARSSRLRLNLTNASTNTSQWGNTDPTSLNFTVSGAITNSSGATYIAYLFAHDAGGFGLTGTDNVISCGSYTGTGANGNNVTLGYEPQWLLIKRTNAIDPWLLFDNMRGMSYTDNKILYPNDAQAEDSAGGWVSPTATGFVLNNTQSSSNGSGSTYIYIAIRRGPMKVPTDATKVFSPVAASNSGDYVVNAGFPPDTVLATLRDFTSGYNHSFFDRLRGNSNYLASSSTNAESGIIVSPTNQIADFSRNQNGIFISSGTVFAYSTLLGITYVWHNFRRAPSFFDEVCYTGNATDRTITHNLTVAPELMIVKIRSASGFNWEVWSKSTTVVSPYGRDTLKLNLTNAAGTTGYFPTDPTSSVFSISFNNQVNSNGNTFVAYLFATCAGVSKVGSYTGTGATQTISCGFTGGARFVMVKRTDSTGDWYVWDTARGMTAGTDPSFLLNTTGVEVNANSIYTTAGGFQIVSTDAGINASGGTYIFLAIA